ncbi:YecA/YgfB family protein [Salinibius halmophilus]|uniref:YecA/YgfB family protein n=1 Tax=Salinibius halmophilus TaxID=1853216 RepID=UPI000E66AC64|nr:YecA family protein [Salinibius halmophilus]
MATTEDELLLLEQIFDAEDAHEMLPDFASFHGMLTAAAMDPLQPDVETVWQIVMDEVPNAAQPGAQVKTITAKLLQEIKDELFSEDALALPFDIDDTETVDDEMSWCCGFMEWAMVREDDWFAEHEAEVAELLLPVQAGSGLFDDEPDMQALKEDGNLWHHLRAQIPDVLTDLYLLLNVPTNKGGKAKRH